MPSIQEIEIVMSLLNNSTAGYDDLQPSIMNRLAKVIPIYKSDDKQLIQNYRPISVISYLSQVFENIMYNHVIDFL